MWTADKLMEVNLQIASARALVKHVQDRAEDDDEDMAERMFHIGEYLDNELEGIKDWFSRHSSPGIVFEDNETESAHTLAEAKISLAYTAAVATAKAARFTAKLAKAIKAGFGAADNPAHRRDWFWFIAVWSGVIALVVFSK
jgi:hypothetical protein